MLPVLLEKGDQVVARPLDVGDELVLGQLVVADCAAETEDFLSWNLTMNGSSLIVAVMSPPFARSFGNFPLCSDRAYKPLELPQDSVACMERVVLPRQLLEELLVLVEPLQRLDVHVGDSIHLRLVSVLRVAEHTDP